ncbi:MULTISPECIES: endonuclease [unclassified Achromobacter]|uniref:endonuclease n=1 Tax=unclassified Achromobacter TaxID=2626865 RepID=UPI000B51A8CA|nr:MULTISPECIES: endonuclease [unclassified Achromobacter]OWT77079.1 endonuclease [Achromobacter sp. HZ28]OWT77960.1 endonuclease [Achromobacter sp. HZ34]
MKNVVLLHAVALSLAVLSLPAHATDPDLVTRKTAVGHRDFRKAKEVLPTVYQGREHEYYCGCAYSGKQVDLASCGYKTRMNLARAQRIEWEHIVPAWTLGHQRQCWQDKSQGSSGRKNCEKNDAAYRKAEGDLVNLVPSVGEVNGDRQNFPYSQWTSGKVSMYGQCQTAVDFKNRAVQPRPEIRGEISRIQMYMATTYSLKLSKQDRQLFCAWSRQYPVSTWEQERNRRIVSLQGSGNRYVTDATARDAFCR